MDKLIAYCGLDCTQCPGYIATQANDMAALEKVAAEWREAFKAPDITVKDVLCDGCTSTTGRLSGYCGQCEVRACAVGRAVENCAHCDDYGCAKLQAFWSLGPQAKAGLDEIRQGLIS